MEVGAAPSQLVQNQGVETAMCSTSLTIYAWSYGDEVAFFDPFQSDGILAGPTERDVGFDCFVVVKRLEEQSVRGVISLEVESEIPNVCSRGRG